MLIVCVCAALVAAALATGHRWRRTVARFRGNPQDPRAVTWIVPHYLPDQNAGSEQMAHRINRFLVSKGYTVSVLTHQRRPSVAALDGVGLGYLPDPASWPAATARTGLLVTQYDRNLWVHATAAAADLPLVAVLHEELCGHYFRLWRNLMPGTRTRAIFNSEWLAAACDHPRDQSIILRPPVDFREFPLVRGGTLVTLLNVSRRKGGDVFARIAARLPDLPFLGVIGHYDSQLTKQPPPNLTYEPNAPDVRTVLARTRVLCVPSRYETYGQVAVEAMSCGIPVVAAPTPGLLEACAQAALFAEISDVDAWAAHVRRLCTDPAFYARMSAAGVARSRALDPVPTLERLRVWMEQWVG